jgi:hypothetical protein
VITSAAESATGVVDSDVATVNVDGPYEPGAGLVMPATVNAKAVCELDTEQAAFPSVIVTAFDVVVADATVQLPKLLVNATAGEAGTVKDGSNCTVTVSPSPR